MPLTLATLIYGICASQIRYRNFSHEWSDSTASITIVPPLQIQQTDKKTDDVELA